jgi:hypothetical protein
MKMKLLKFLNSALIACAAVGAATHASAAIELSVNSEVGAVGDPVVVTYDYSALDADNANFFQFDLTFDTNALTLTNFSNCGNNAPATHISQCTNPSPGVVRVIISDQSLPFEEISPLSITPFGQVTFTIDQPGVTPIGIIDAIGGDQTGTALTVNTSDGTVEGTITGNSGFASSPAPGSTIALGTGDVGSASSLSPQLITVSEIGDETLDVTALTFTGANASSFSTTTAPFTIADGGSDVIVDVNCTPDARGDLTGTLELTNNSVNNPNPQYSLTCAGTSPNVAAAPLTVNLNGTIGQTNPTGIFDITNADDGFTSNALNAALAESGTAEISITDGLTDTTISVDETDQIQVECDTTSAGTFNETISLTYDDPLGTGGTSQIDVTVNCEIANAFPVYESVPTPGSTLAFGPITNGDTSAPLGVDVGNSGAVGGADLNVTAASITGADAAQFDLTFTPFTVTAGAAPDGTDDITVTCSPDTVDPFTADLVVNTDDPAEPAGGFTYPLTCEGTSNAVFDSDPEPNGTLNLGVVPPGSTTPEGFIDFSNEGTSDELSVACTVTDSEGVFTVDPTTIDFTIQAGDTESVGFQCTPPTPGSFTASLACDITGTVGPISTGYDVVCQGEPLVVPTLDRWGLLLMALFVLGIGGLAGRRMMA